LCPNSAVVAMLMPIHPVQSGAIPKYPTTLNTRKP
jgi:hypothetical protein